MRPLITIIVLLVFCTPFFSQEERKPLPLVNIRASCTIPKAVSSQAFRISYSGVYDANVSLNFKLGNNFNIGLGYENAFFNDQLYFRQKGLNTRLQEHNGFVRVGIDRMFVERRGFYSFSVSSGYSFNKYTDVVHSQDSLNGKFPNSFATYFVKPEVALNFLVEESFAFGISLSYNYCFNVYDPAYNAFGEYISYKQYRNKANMGWISFGFGFYYGFKKKRP
ncbi:MAG: hypothetical protein ACXVPQ_07175 [Bacteroidia bacterium]